MLIAKITDTGITVAEHTALFSETSFTTTGPNADFMTENNCLHVSVWHTYDSETEELVSVAPYIENGVVYTVKAISKPIESELK